MRKIFLAGLSATVLAIGGCGGGGEEKKGDTAPAVGAPASTAAQGIDCKAATEEADKAVCGDKQLLALDAEMTRLLALTKADPKPAFTPAELAKAEDDFVTARTMCGQSPDLKACIAADYAERIADLRQGSSHARSEDAKGVSDGPFAYRCEGLDALISATFINTESSVAMLKWLDKTQYLVSAPTGSGAKYLGKSDDGGEVSFWTKGDEALFQLPGAKELRCKQEPEDD